MKHESKVSGGNQLIDVEQPGVPESLQILSRISLSELPLPAFSEKDEKACMPEPESNELADDPELVREFIVESREHLASVETGLLAIERNPRQREALHAVFRSFHTIKGLAGFLGAQSIQELAHETESVLDLVRGGSLALGPDLTDLILQSADALTQLLLLAEDRKLSILPPADPLLLLRLLNYSNPGVHPALVEATTASVSVPPTQTATRSAIEHEETEVAGTTDKKPAEVAAVRVDLAKLEYLIDMVGELVIAESVVRNDPSVTAAESPVLSRNLAQLARVIEEVQKTSMSMRMVPVGSLFRKMNRLVRDLSRKSGKQVELITAGDDVELDRTIVEELADPMVHMIRNAVDHGLETAEERRNAGKAECGSVKLKASHDAGDIVIEIRMTVAGSRKSEL